MIIDENKNKWTYIFKGLGIIFMYFFISIYKSAPFELLHINPEDLSAYIKIAYNLILEITMIFGIYIVYEKEIKLAIKDIKKNHKTYFDKYLKVYLIGVIIMMLSNFIISIYGGGISENESSIRNQFELYPIYTFVSAVCLAPILEEMIFRLGFRSIIKNKYLYIAISGLVFGGLHLMGMPVDKLFLLYLLSYCSEGFAFAYMMSKSNNILISTAFHFMHNGLIMSLQFFLLIFS